LALLLILLSACSVFGVAKPETFNQKLAYAIGVHTSILQAATAAVTSGALTSSDAEAIAKQADTARAIIDVAKVAAAAGDAPGADHKLAIALAALTALQGFLNSHGGHAP